MVIPLRLAKKAALLSSHHQRHAALVFKGGALLSVGINANFKHAEANALLKLWPSKRIGTTLLSYRLTPAGSIGNAKPCIRCMELLRISGVSRIYYSTSEGEVVML